MALFFEHGLDGLDGYSCDKIFVQFVFKNLKSWIICIFFLNNIRKSIKDLRISGKSSTFAVGISTTH